MIKNVLTHIGSIENYGMISIAIFFGVFLGVLAWALTRKKSELDAMSAMPLEKETTPVSTQLPENRP